MNGLNKVILMGNIVQQIEAKSFSGDKFVTNFTLAVNTGFGDHKRADFIDIKVYGNKANLLEKHTNKGDVILIEGKIQMDSWEREGKKYYKTYVLADEVTFVNLRSKTSRESSYGKFQ